MSIKKHKKYLDLSAFPVFCVLTITFIAAVTLWGFCVDFVLSVLNQYI